MKEEERLKLFDLIRKITEVEKEFKNLSFPAQKELEDYALKHIEETAKHRAKKGISPSIRGMFADAVNSITSFLSDTRSDEMKERDPQTDGKYEEYSYKGKLFRYDFDNGVVEYGFSQTKEQIAEQVEKAQEESGKTYTQREIELFYGKPGWNTIDSVGLSIELWYDVEARNGYLDEYIDEMEETLNYIVETEFQPKENKGPKKTTRTR